MTDREIVTRIRRESLFHPAPLYHRIFVLLLKIGRYLAGTTTGIFGAGILFFTKKH